MFRNKSVDVHQFAMVPSSAVPRSSFRIQKNYKTTFDAGYLIPVFVDEVLPGDSFNLKMTAFCRMATPLYPLMDNLYLESFFFFVPNRLVWQNFKRFMGEQSTITDDITVFSIPQVVSPAGGWPPISLGDYFGLPTAGTNGIVAPNTITTTCLPFRAYNLIWNEWFRDQNLQNPVNVSVGDGPDLQTNFVLLRRGKRHDYFTSCLPWPQKGTSVSLPLGTSAPVIPSPVGGAFPTFRGTSNSTERQLAFASGTIQANWSVTGTAAENARWGTTGLIADLATATSATINQIRQSFQMQKLLERDARGGTRYTELVRSHFGVVSPDARLQRTEYLGGGSVPIHISQVPQTSGTPTAGGGSPLGTLGAQATVVAHGHGFSQSFTEHGMIIGLINVRADLTYQQGLRRYWSKRTRYDFYWPVFATLGEQAVLNKEIFMAGTPGPANDDGVFGYQERWAEYRYNPSEITGFFRSTGATPLDAWHLAQEFTAVPQLIGGTFIQDNPPISRVTAVATSAGLQFLADLFFDIKAARPMPMYSVPGMIDHF